MALGVETTDFLLEAFVRVSGTVNSNLTIMSKQSGAALTDPGYIFRILSGTTTTTDGRLEGRIIDTGGSSASVITTATYNDNTPHHVALAVDRDTSMTLYVDGVAITAYDQQDDPSSINDLSTSTPFYVGSLGNNTQMFSGSMCEVRVWDYLSVGMPTAHIADIITDHYNYPGKISSIASTAYLTARYPMQSDKGAGVSDVSDNTNNLNFNDTSELTFSGISLDYVDIGPIPQQTKRTADTNYDTTVKKFVGHVSRFEIDRKNTGGDIIRVVCRSVDSFLKESINLNYPNKWDYWISEFGGLEFNATRPDGIDFPPTYDGWPLESAFKSLMVRGHIDPSLFVQKNQYLNNASEVVSGTFLIEPSIPTVVLEKARNYGNSAGVFEFEAIDDEYRQKTNFGDLIFDYVNDIVEPYGWEWGTNAFYDGAPYLRARNNPRDIIGSEDSRLTYNASWSDKQAELDAVSGTYRTTSTAADYVEYSFQGQRIDTTQVLYSSNGGAQATVASGTTTAQFTLMNLKGDALAVGNRLIFELPDGNEDSVIASSLGDNEYTISTALSEIPPSGTLVRTAVGVAEVRRGDAWATATPIASGFLPAYFEHGLDKILPPNRITTEAIEQKIAVTGTARFFHHGIEPDNGINPTLFKVATGLTRDDHIIRITRIPNAEAGASTVLGWNAFFIYDRDRSFPIQTFRTGDSVTSGTVLQLTVMDSGEDERNDVIVVGRRIGVEVPGGFSDRPINPNNPEGKFIASRATDIASIYNSNAKNFIGRPTQSILIEPSIGSQDRADYWAVSFLNRFRFVGREADFQLLANPAMEIGDCVLIDDENKNSIDLSNRVWIEGNTLTFGQSNALSRIETTSFEPWPSFTPKVEVSPADFNNQAFINVKMENNGTADSPYDPYSLDESGTVVSITFDLVLSGYLRVEVITHNGVKVADLLNPDGEEGKQGYVRETAGSNKKVTWDGVDLVGAWNENKIPGVSDAANYFAVEDDYLKNSSGDNYGRFYLLFTLEADDGTVYTYDTSADSSLEGHNYIFTRRGDQIAATSTVTPLFVPSPDANFIPTGFTSASNDGRGLQVEFNVTNAGVRPAQLYVTFEHVAIGTPHLSQNHTTGEVGGPPVSRRSRSAPRILGEENVESKTLELSDFVDYAADQVYYFNPAKVLNMVYSDWVSHFGYDPDDPASYSIDDLRGFRIGHYFLLKFELIDKSGRTAEVSVPHIWFEDGKDITPIRDNPKAVFIGDTSLGLEFGHFYLTDVVGRRRR